MGYRQCQPCSCFCFFSVGHRRSEGSQSFSYDPFGNIKKTNNGGATAYSANYSTATNQVSSGISPAPLYDQNGNQKNLTASSGSLTWNALNQPITFNTYTSATYDALGRMVETYNATIQGFTDSNLNFYTTTVFASADSDSMSVTYPGQGYATPSNFDPNDPTYKLAVELGKNGAYTLSSPCFIPGFYAVSGAIAAGVYVIANAGELAALAAENAPTLIPMGIRLFGPGKTPIGPSIFAIIGKAGQRISKSCSAP